jgi:Tol biopolymer transport system component
MRSLALMADVGSVEACSLTVGTPDGKKIAFTMFVAQTGQSNHYTVNPDGSDLHQVTYSGLGAGLKDWGTHPLTH